MVRFIFLCALILLAHEPAHGHGHDLARTKTQGRLLWFWVVCLCPKGVLYGHMGTIQPQTGICHYGRLLVLACLISQVIQCYSIRQPLMESFRRHSTRHRALSACSSIILAIDCGMWYIICGHGQLQLRAASSEKEKEQAQARSSTSLPLPP